MHKKFSLLLLIIVGSLLTGCETKGKLIENTEVGLKVVDKHSDLEVDFEDTNTEAKITIQVSYAIYGALDIDSVVQADKSEYSKNNETKYYYKIKTVEYNMATESELWQAKSKVSNKVEVVITGKNIRKKLAGQASKRYNYLYYKHGNNSYTTEESVSDSAYKSATLGQTVNAIKTEYVLSDDRLVTKYKLIIE